MTEFWTAVGKYKLPLSCVGGEQLIKGIFSRYFSRKDKHKVILYSNDRNLCVKCMVHQIDAFGSSDQRKLLDIVDNAPRRPVITPQRHRQSITPRQTTSLFKSQYPGASLLQVIGLHHIPQMTRRLEIQSMRQTQTDYKNRTSDQTVSVKKITDLGTQECLSDIGTNKKISSR
jgi:hypothetical protein